MKINENKLWAVWRLLTFVLLVGLAFFGFREIEQRQKADARAERTAALSACRDGNKRTETIRAVFLKAIADPPPESFDFIKDPVLRKGAIENGNHSRAQIRQEIETNLSPRDCDKEIPAPPED